MVESHTVQSEEFFFGVSKLCKSNHQPAVTKSWWSDQASDGDEHVELGSLFPHLFQPAGCDQMAISVEQHLKWLWGHTQFNDEHLQGRLQEFADSGVTPIVSQELIELFSETLYS